ncbi:MAG TPA: ABC transporter substrate-binding protein [Luteibaculaceae bacterium]|nr:ABC transporter substrate-binding protein [Luteibaculaceae bacterium]
MLKRVHALFSINYSWFTALLSVLCILITSCNPPAEDRRGQATTSYAKHFTIEEKRDSLIIHIQQPWLGGQLTTIAVSKHPNPIRLAPLSSSFIGFLDALSCIDSVVAVESRAFIYNQRLNERIAKGLTREIGGEAQQNTEKLIACKPTHICISGGPGGGSSFAALKGLGTVVVPVLDWQEEHPLGRAEWIKVFGALCGKYREACLLFDAISERYLNLAKIPKDSAKSPTVVLGYHYQGSWYLPGGKSFVATLLRDAGFAYALSQNNETASVSWSFEQVVSQFLKADIWLNPGLCKRYPDLLALDTRYLQFAAVQHKAVFNNTRLMNDAGGNAFWEEAPVAPDKYLADLIEIRKYGAQARSLYFYQGLSE